ncbi:DUF4279 domain-containing protein [Lysobacter maris]|uniref:DUF4279 domain-containing protein n=1 Tax=Marilutibacter maris TaxID=1605891 RepID=A0A508B351_9GAMM|nr:DUF4279 domain-containing protein [Lysobacter maris]KAB8194410.1 DUF4279 domain-containing protein [Lysobacter maris]
MNELLRYQLSLRISHPSIAADMIGQELGLVPLHAYTAGDEKRTPKGTAIRGKPRKMTFWVSKIADTDASTSLEDALLTLTRKLATRQAFLAELVASGGRVEYFVGLFVDRCAGVEISSALMVQLVKLGIDLSFDVYGVDDLAGVGVKDGGVDRG